MEGEKEGEKEVRDGRMERGREREGCHPGRQALV